MYVLICILLYNVHIISMHYQVVRLHGDKNDTYSICQFVSLFLQEIMVLLSPGGFPCSVLELRKY